VVLAGAGLFIRTMINLRSVPLGYTPEGLVFVETTNPVGRPRAFVEDTLAELKSLPGVRQATVSQWPIFNNTVLRFPFCIPGADPVQQRLDLSFVFPGFFATWGVALVQGHDIEDRGEPVAIVNETFVRRFFPTTDPIGQVLGSGGDCPGRTQLRIVAVAADHIDRQRAELVPAVYMRYPMAGALYSTTYAVRTAGDERALIPAVRRVVGGRGMAPNRDVRTGVDYRDSITRREQLLTMLLVCFGAVSLFISCLGVYGMLAYTVSWRTPEIGVRVAIGATRAHLMWMILREALASVLLGVCVGIGGARSLAGPIESLLFGVSSHDPATLTSAALVLVGAAWMAAALAARRACRIEPLSALRYE
jgi:hypothetical protein